MPPEKTSTPDHGNETLKPYIFTAESKKVFAKQTPYGKWIKGLEGQATQLFQEAKSGYLEVDDSQNVEGRYALAYRRALNNADKGNYEDLMRLCLNYVNISPAEQENMVFDEVPTPQEAEKIFMEMGKRQFPELEKAGFEEVRKLWTKTGMGEVPKEFFPPRNRNMKEVLPALRGDLQSMMIWSHDLLAPSAGAEGIKLCYAMMILERGLAQSMGQIPHPDMTMWERLAIDEERKKLS